MRYFILGCGSTGAEMPALPDTHVIGVNDANKFNKPMNELLFLNSSRHFNEAAIYAEGKSRLDIIKESKVSQVVTLHTCLSQWEEIFPGIVRKIAVTRWSKVYQPQTIYHCDSSPFTAMSYAVTLGFTEIVLWGVDFINHRYLKAESSAGYYSDFASRVSHKCNIYKGSKESKLTLPVWTQE